jgi:hypothetical protein
VPVARAVVDADENEEIEAKWRDQRCARGACWSQT